MKNENGLLILGASFSVLALSGFLFRKQIKTKINTLTNQQHLNSLHPKYKNKFIQFYNAVIKAGYTPQINSSFRTFEQQAKEHRANKKNAPAGFSPHNYGLSIDMQISKGGKTWGKSTPVNEWKNTGLIETANKLGIAWGGTFKGYNDAVHFYIPLDTAKLYRMALEQFKTNNPRNIIGNRVNLS